MLVAFPLLIAVPGLVIGVAVIVIELFSGDQQ